MIVWCTDTKVQAKITTVHMTGDARKLVFMVSNQVRHKPACTVTESSWKLEISDLSRRGIVLTF